MRVQRLGVEIKDEFGYFVGEFLIKVAISDCFATGYLWCLALGPRRGVFSICPYFYLYSFRLRHLYISYSSFLTPACKINPAVSSVASCPLRELLQLPTCLPLMEAACFLISLPDLCSESCLEPSYQSPCLSYVSNFCLLFATSIICSSILRSCRVSIVEEFLARVAN